MSRSPDIDLLADLRERGIELAVEGEWLRFRPVTAVNAELRERMTRLKPELIALLHPAAYPSFPAEEVPIPDFGDGDRPSVERCPACREGDFMRPRPRGCWCCARCNPYEGLAPDDLEWWPRVEGSLVPLHDVLGLERGCRGSPDTDAFLSGELGSKIEV